MLERNFQSGMIKKLKNMFPDALIFKNDANYKQGIPDILILCGPKWALLESKRSADAPHRPNQDYYVAKGNSMGGLAMFIYPENSENALESLKAFFSN